MTRVSEYTIYLIEKANIICELRLLSNHKSVTNISNEDFIFFESCKNLCGEEFQGPLNKYFQVNESQDCENNGRSFWHAYVWSVYLSEQDKNINETKLVL